MLRPEWVLILATVLWGTSWLPLQWFAAQGIDGFPMVLASYGLIAVFALPLLHWQRHRRRATPEGEVDRRSRTARMRRTARLCNSR